MSRHPEAITEPVRKKRRLSPPNPTEINGETALLSSSLQNTQFFKNAANWNLEQSYEQKSRKRKQDNEQSRLPIKTAEGHVQHLSATSVFRTDDSINGPVDSDVELLDDGIEGEEAFIPESEVPLKQQIFQAKEKLAEIASLLNESPEEHIGQLKKLSEIASSTNPTITKLALATQCSVYKDIVPSYRIRPVTAEEESLKKVSKDVRKLRNFEQTLVRSYERYISELGRISALSQKHSQAEISGNDNIAMKDLSKVALSCACNLLVSLPHFNFRSNLISIILKQLGRSPRYDANADQEARFNMSISALQTLFQGEEDTEGAASHEAVSMISKAITSASKSRNAYRDIDPRVLNLFLHLRLLSEFQQKASATKVEKADGTEKVRNPKQKRDYLTKKERKARKERKAIEKEMEEADAHVSYEHRDKMQAETLKLVFAVYFRVLKARTTAPHLTGPVLEGLVKYAHLINQDFFGDLLEGLRELVLESTTVSSLSDDSTEDEDAMDIEDEDQGRNLTRESLLCVITAFALLSGQDGTKVASSLHLDLSFFISHLFQTLYPASLNADIELSASQTSKPSPSTIDSTDETPRRKVNVQTTIVLLLRSLNAVLLPENSRSVPPSRLAAFTKQIFTCALHLPEKSSTAMLGLLAQVLKTHKTKIIALWNSEERKGDGVFNPLSTTIEGSNAFAANVWEAELLRLHYAPTVRDGIRTLDKLVGA